VYRVDQDCVLSTEYHAFLSVAPPGSALPTTSAETQAGAGGSWGCFWHALNPASQTPSFPKVAFIWGLSPGAAPAFWDCSGSCHKVPLPPSSLPVQMAKSWGWDLFPTRQLFLGASSWGPSRRAGWEGLKLT
jgi:hypothetical protein